VALNCKFNKLFENTLIEIDEKFLRNLKKEEYEFYPESKNRFKNSNKKYIITDTWRFALYHKDKLKNKKTTKPSKDHFDIDFENTKTPKIIKKELIKELSSLKIKKSILKKVNNFLKKNKLKNYVGVHIRKGDFVNKENLDCVSPIEKFFDEIKKHSVKNQKIFLATDNKKIEQIFKKNFKNKLTTFNKKPVNRNLDSSIIESLIELLILSKSKIIIGTYESTYSELAWWLSKNNTKIIIAIDKKRLNNLNQNRINQSTLKEKLVFNIKRKILKLLKRNPLFYD